MFLPTDSIEPLPGQGNEAIAYSGELKDYEFDAFETSTSLLNAFSPLSNFGDNLFPKEDKGTEHVNNEKYDENTINAEGFAEPLGRFSSLSPSAQLNLAIFPPEESESNGLVVGKREPSNIPLANQNIRVQYEAQHRVATEVFSQDISEKIQQNSNSAALSAHRESSLTHFLESNDIRTKIPQNPYPESKAVDYVPFDHALCNPKLEQHINLHPNYCQYDRANREAVIETKSHVRRRKRRQSSIPPGDSVKSCHICTQSFRETGSDAIFCTSIERRRCKKAVCLQCIRLHGWDVTNSLLDKESRNRYICPHCQGLCSSLPWARCFRYRGRRKKVDN